MRLSIPQWQILENHRLQSEGKKAEYFPRNRSQSGGWGWAEKALVRKGYLFWFCGELTITDAGREALSDPKKIP